MSSIFKIFSKEDCDFYYDGELQGHIIGNSDKAFRFEVERKGSYRVRFVHSLYKSEIKMTLLIGSDEEQDIDLDFNEVNTLSILEKANPRQLYFESEVQKRRVRYSYSPCLLIPIDWEGFWGFMDWNGNEVIPCVYDQVDGFKGGYARVCRDSKWGLLDIKGNEVVACGYSDIGVCAEGLVCVEKEGKWGYVDIETGKELVIGLYDYVYIFSEGIARVERSDRYGFIDKYGREIAPCIYKASGFFREGLAVVNKDGKVGYIDNTGKVAIPFVYDGASDFIDGFAPVKKNDKFGFIDKTAKVVVPCIYDDAKIRNVDHYFVAGVATVKKNDKWGFVNTSGKEIVPCVYDTLFYSDGERAFFGKNSETGYITGYVYMNGKEEIC